MNTEPPAGGLAGVDDGATDIAELVFSAGAAPKAEGEFPAAKPKAVLPKADDVLEDPNAPVAGLTSEEALAPNADGWPKADCPNFPAPPKVPVEAPENAEVGCVAPNADAGCDEEKAEGGFKGFAPRGFAPKGLGAFELDCPKTDCIGVEPSCANADCPEFVAGCPKADCPEAVPPNADCPGVVVDCPNADCPNADCPEAGCPNADCPEVACPKADCPGVEPACPNAD